MSTIKTAMEALKPFFKEIQQILRPEDDLDALSRQDIETVIVRLQTLPPKSRSRCLIATRAMLQYMAESSQWLRGRPSRNLIWNEDIERERIPSVKKDAIPDIVLQQLGAILHEMIQGTASGQYTSLVRMNVLNVICIMRATGMRCVDVVHLRSITHHDGCLDQDKEGDYWLTYIDAKTNKLASIPIFEDDGVRQAIIRQEQQNASLSNQKEYLFTNKNDILTYDAVKEGLEKLAPYLLYENKPYCITPHQFRNTIASDMIYHGVSVKTVERFLGHTNLETTERYINLTKEQEHQRSQHYQQPAPTTPQKIAFGETPRALPNTIHWKDDTKLFYYVDHPSGLGYCLQMISVESDCDSCCLSTCVKFRSTYHYLDPLQSYLRELKMALDIVTQDTPPTITMYLERTYAFVQRVIVTLEAKNSYP